MARTRDLSRSGRAIGRRVLVVLLALVASSYAWSSALASHEDGFYELPAWDMWDQAHLNVIVVPPAHGPIFGPEGFLTTKDPAQLTPFNAYLRAVEDSIAEWQRGVERFGSSQLKTAFDIRVYVAGRDLIPPDALASPDIWITTTEDTPIGLGVAIRPYPCVVNNSYLFGIANYADIYNINGQEYGHCLGVNHVGDQGGIDPGAGLQHPEHDIMNGFYTHDLGDANTHRHCVSNLDVLALEYVFAHRNGIIPVLHRTSATFSQKVEDYRTTCDAAFTDPPPVPWVAPSPAPSSSPEPITQLRSYITSPTDGQSLPRSQFDIVTGMTDEPATATEIALRRMAQGECFWLTAARRLVRGGCDAPRWLEVGASGDWAFEVRVDLPRGRYELRSRALDAWTGYEETEFERGRNLVALRLR